MAWRGVGRRRGADPCNLRGIAGFKNYWKQRVFQVVDCLRNSGLLLHPAEDQLIRAKKETLTAEQIRELLPYRCARPRPEHAPCKQSHSTPDA